MPTADPATATKPAPPFPANRSSRFLVAAPASPRSILERTEEALREAGLAGQFWRGDALSVSPLPSTPSGFRALDEELPGGGWPSRCLTELLLSHTGVGEIRFIASTLSALTLAGRDVVLLAPPHVPDPTGWEQLGIDMRRVLIVRTERPGDRLWAIEQSLRSSAFGALVAWLPEDRTLARHDALRRLQSVAAASSGLTFLMRPAAAQYHASPAPLRLTLSAGKPEGTRRTLSVRLVKRRGPVLADALTLALPEVHRGLKAFSPAMPQRSMAASTAPTTPPASSSAESWTGSSTAPSSFPAPKTAPSPWSYGLPHRSSLSVASSSFPPPRSSSRPDSSTPSSPSLSPASSSSLSSSSPSPSLSSSSPSPPSRSLSLPSSSSSPSSPSTPSPPRSSSPSWSSTPSRSSSPLSPSRSSPSPSSSPSSPSSSPSLPSPSSSRSPLCRSSIAPVPHDVSPLLAAHALAGSPLSDAAA